jgi:hypothetical protein
LLDPLASLLIVTTASEFSPRVAPTSTRTRTADQCNLSGSHTKIFGCALRNSRDADMSQISFSFSFEHLTTVAQHAVAQNRKIRDAPVEV